MPYSHTPAYNLKVVLKETGIAADTLRAWERRYGLPMPERTEGGHRLYSQRDIGIIKWLMKQQAEGLSISRAVDLWNEKLASGSDPLADSVSRISTTLTTFSSPDTNLDSLRTAWVNACMDFNESAAEQTLNQAFAIFPMEAVCMDILQKGMSEIGSRWYENKASVQQEHFASGLAMRRLDALFSAAPAPTRKETVIVGCPANEWHTFTSLLISLLLRRTGYKIIYLGANVPADHFAETVKDTKADLVLLVAQQLISAATLQGTAQTLTHKEIPVAFGGYIFNLHPSLMDYIPGYFLGNDVGSAIGEIEKILKSKSVPKANKAASQGHIAAHQAYTSKRTKIEASLKEIFQPLAISPDDINAGIHFLGDQITAALQLGDMSYVSSEMEWLKTLLRAHNRPAAELSHFMDSYAQAVDKNINGSGAPIKSWLANEAAKLKV